MRLILSISLLLLFQVCSAQIILTEVMFDADTLENYNEFIEIYNSGTAPIDLSGWLVGDSVEQDLLQDAGNGLLLQPQQYGLILDPGYFENSTTYDELIPPDALVLTIEDASFGSFGLSNSHAEPIILLNSAGDTVQQYVYSLNNDPGYSDEKIILSPDNSQGNWGNSLSFRGTPGAKNSISPKEIDLSLGGFHFLDNNFLVGESLPFEAVVKNLGQQTVVQFQFHSFIELNDNGLPDSSEILKTFQINTPIIPGDSLQIENQFENIPAGNITFGVAITVSGDEDSTNNVRLNPAFVNDPLNLKLVINEILFEPLAGYEEWIEIYNSGTTTINLLNIYFADARDTIQVSKTDFLLNPGEYLVVGGDSAIASQYNLSFTNLVIAKGFPTLNNSNDDLKLMNSFDFVYDRVSYTSEWYGRDTEPGTSLEKINPTFNGQISANWAASVAEAGSTPADVNSVFVDVLPQKSRLQVAPNPFSPDGDGFEDATVISFEVPAETASARIRIFDTRGRQIRLLADNQPVASQGQFVWDGKDDSGRIGRIGAYICLLEFLNSSRNVTEQLKATIILVKQ